MSNEKLFAFVLMPFSSSFDDIYKFGIKEAAHELGLHAERVDEQIYSEGMLERIYNQIDLADIIIADMSGKNANVFYEVGYAHAKEKPCILLTSNIDDIPFDLAHRRHIIYNGSIKTLKTQLTESLKWAKKEVETVKNSDIKVEFSSVWGDLETTKYIADGTLNFKVDLSNKTGRNSPEIEAIYAYSGKGWKSYQDGKECPSIDSDIKGFNKKHLLQSPARKLLKGQWSQLQYKTKKTLAYAYKGEELKDKYRISGRTILRIMTSRGNYDYEYLIDKEVEEFPF